MTDETKPINERPATEEEIADIMKQIGNISNDPNIATSSHVVGDAHSDPTDSPRYSQPAIQINKLLWVERNERESRGRGSKENAMEEVLQVVWNRIVEATISQEKWCKSIGHPFLEDDIGQAYVDGTIYEVANDFESAIKSVKGMQHILSHTAWTIISKDIETYESAVGTLRYRIMSKEGRRRLNITVFGE